MSNSQQNYQQAYREFDPDGTTNSSTETRLAPANPYSFSLSSLFLVVTAIGVFLGLSVNFPAFAAFVAVIALPTIVIYFFRILPRRRAGEILLRCEQAFEMVEALALVFRFYGTAIAIVVLVGFAFELILMILMFIHL